MKINIDLDKASMEELFHAYTVLREKIDFLKENTIKKQSERKKETKEEKSISESFLIDKYQRYIQKTLIFMAGRERPTMHFHPDEDRFRINEFRSKLKHTLYVTEIDLFKEFLKVSNEFNLSDINPLIFRKAFKKIKGHNDFEHEEFVVEKIKIGKKDIYKVIF